MLKLLLLLLHCWLPRLRCPRPPPAVALTPAVAHNVVDLAGDLRVGHGGQVGEGLEEPGGQGGRVVGQRG